MEHQSDDISEIDMLKASIGDAFDQMYAMASVMADRLGISIDDARKMGQLKLDDLRKSKPLTVPQQEMLQIIWKRY